MKKGHGSTLAGRDTLRCVGHHPVGFIQHIEKFLLFFLR